MCLSALFLFLAVSGQSCLKYYEIAVLLLCLALFSVANSHKDHLCFRTLELLPCISEPLDTGTKVRCTTLHYTAYTATNCTTHRLVRSQRRTIPSSLSLSLSFLFFAHPHPTLILVTGPLPEHVCSMINQRFLSALPCRSSYYYDYFYYCQMDWRSSFFHTVSF